MKKYILKSHCMYSVLLWLLTAMVIIPATGSAQDTSSFTVQQAVDYALKHQVAVVNSGVDTEIAEARIDELIGVGLPQIKGSAELNDFLEVPTQFVPGEFFEGEEGEVLPVQFGLQYSASAGISASQLLFDGTYFVGLKASRTFVDLAMKRYSQTKIETATNVTKAYYLVLVAEERLKQLTSDLDRLDKLRSDTRALFDNGFVEKIDYDRIELNYNLVVNAHGQTSRLVANSYNLLKFQMGYELKNPIQLSESIADIKPNPDPQLSDTVNYNNRIEYSILQSQHKLAGHDLQRYRVSRWPSIFAIGNFSYNTARNDFTIFESGTKWYPTAIVGATLSVPIFGGFKINSQVRQARLKYEQVENSFFMVQQSLQLEYKNALTNYRNNLDKLETNSRNRDLAREIARVSRIKYEEGVGSNLEVIEDESSLREAETNYYTSLLEAIISKIDLDKASGNIKY